MQASHLLKFLCRSQDARKGMEVVKRIKGLQP